MTEHDMNQPKQTEHLLSLDEVADWLGVPLGTLKDWRLHGEGPTGFRLGKHVRFRACDVEEWLETQRESVA